jgi:rSAM/selenodomain-associated transferase 1
MPRASAVLLFVKAPEKGRVKSRLAETIGEELAAEAYKLFVSDIVGTIREAGYPLRIFFHPPDSADVVSEWLGKNVVPQEGKDLGERMENAFARSFSQGLEKAVLIGTDVPDLKTSVIGEAFETLGSNEAVIGPASDGGYYLIGFGRTSFRPEIFRGIEWGSDSVFSKTMKIFGEVGSKVHTLPEWGDVDTVEDLRSLVMRNRDSDFMRSRTITWAMRHREEIFGAHML